MMSAQWESVLKCVHTTEKQPPCSGVVNHGGCPWQDASLAVFEDLLRDEIAARVSGELEYRRRRKIMVRVLGLLEDLDAPGYDSCPQGAVLVFGKIVDRIRKIYLIHDL